MKERDFASSLGAFAEEWPRFKRHNHKERSVTATPTAGWTAQRGEVRGNLNCGFLFALCQCDSEVVLDEGAFGSAGSQRGEIHLLQGDLEQAILSLDDRGEA